MQSRVIHASTQDFVAVDEFERANIRIGIAPLPTLAMLTFDAVQPEVRLGAPGTLKRAIRAQMRRRDVEALAPFGRMDEAPPPIKGARLACPDSYMQVLCGTPAAGSAGIESALELLVELSPDRLLRGIEECSGSGTYWPTLHERPSAWLRDVAAALSRAWRAVEPMWARGRSLLERELERVAVAAARGAAADATGQVHPGVTIEGDWWRLPNDLGPPTQYRLAPQFTLYPMLVEPQTAVTFHDGAGKINALYYPVAGAWRAFEGESFEAVDSICALLGHQRSEILRLLDDPMTAGALAARLHLAPGGLTHHLRNLEGAGLARRTRRGRHVFVERTPRGTSLLALYE